MPDARAAHLRMHRDRAHLTEIGPQHVQGAAPDQFTVEIDDPELLDRLIQRHQVLFQKDLAGVDVHQVLDPGDIGGAGPAHRGAGRRWRAAFVHSWKSIRFDNRYSVAVPGQPSTDPLVPHAFIANLPNILTGVRLVLVPVFLVLLFIGDGHETFWRIAAFGVFSVAVITDRFDGALARSYGVVAEFGTMADPIADKALIGSALIGLSMLGDLPWWITGVI